MENTITPNNRAHDSHSVSVVILTQGLRRELLESISAVSHQNPVFSRIIIINNSDRPINIDISQINTEIMILTTLGNFGTSIRNIGASLADSKYIVFLDDDVVLSQNDTVTRVQTIFSGNSAPACICFKYKETDSEEFEICSWGHPRDRLEWQDKDFITDCITEGAFAIHREAFWTAGGFWPGIFIGEEGVDLFLRLLRHGFLVKYHPGIQCVHLHSPEGRYRWRGFYHYARSDVLIAWRHLPLFSALSFLFRSALFLLLQSLRSLNPLSIMHALAGACDAVCWILGGRVGRQQLASARIKAWKEIRSRNVSNLSKAWKLICRKVKTW